MEARIRESSRSVSKVKKDLEELGGELNRSFNKLADAASAPMDQEMRKKTLSLMTVILANKQVLDLVIQEAINAGDTVQVKAKWEGYVRFDVEKDARVVLRCERHVIYYRGEGPMLSDSPRTLLVRTEISLGSFQEFFRAFKSGKTMLVFGPAGTGKTETMKDFAGDLGIEATVVSLDQGDLNTDEDDPAKISAVMVKRGIAEKIEKEKSEGGFLVFDGIKNIHLYKNILQAARAAKGPGFIGITAGEAFSEKEVGAKAQTEIWMRYEKFTNFKIIIRSMLAAEGARIESAEALSVKCCEVVEYAASSDAISKNPSYDWGLRFQRTLIKEFGR